MTYNDIRILVSQKLSSRQIAEKLKCSQTNIRYWLKKFNLKTYSRIPSINLIEKTCPKCKENKPTSEFHKKRNGKGFSCYCKICVRNQTLTRQRKIKQKCIDYKGGKCQCCEYDSYIGALEFHHLEKNQKEYTIGQNKGRSFDNLKKELDKCLLVCSNCHREIHGGFKTVAKSS